MWFEIFAGWSVAILVGTVALIQVGRMFPAFAFMLLVSGYLLGGIALGHWLEVSPAWTILGGLSLSAGALCLLAVAGGAKRA
ncbi:MAG: hypothetical protein Q27BPR15_17345 [Rhodobacter sp. CACIA14H1]|nr:MAG: hypothetical protein Q27BPR15_17345 [Rhodobacter sp. CACIA14H1]